MIKAVDIYSGDTVIYKMYHGDTTIYNSIISFADSSVEEIIIQNFDTDNDGIIRYKEAASVTSFQTGYSCLHDSSYLPLFWNTRVDSSNYTGSITSFDEFQYFTGITTIPSHGFQNNVALSSITLPESITVIGDNAFAGCIALTSVNINNLNNITRIGTAAFGGCWALSSFVWPDNVTDIEEGVFSYCRSLISVTIPDSVTSIGRRAFEMCYSLTSITIPSSVTSIGDDAFSNDSSLEVTMLSSIPIQLPVYTNSEGKSRVIAFGPAGTWKSIDKKVKHIYVPSESVNDYKTAPGWEYYADIISAIPDPSISE